jgi:hypothetical protein
LVLRNGHLQENPQEILKDEGEDGEKVRVKEDE